MRLLSPMDLLYPPACILCGRLLEDRACLCEQCRKEAPFFKNSKRKLQFLDSFTAVWYYKGYVRESLLRYKFGGGRDLSAPYGRFLAEKIRMQHPEGFDLLTWVPVSFLRRMKRGYDQCQLLSRKVGKELGIPSTRLLLKVRHNRAQSGLSHPALRRGNVVGAYRVLQKGKLEGKRILLLDDILTTGATAGECARMLKTAGAAEVHCAVLAVSEKES